MEFAYDLLRNYGPTPGPPGSGRRRARSWSRSSTQTASTSRVRLARPADAGLSASRLRDEAQELPRRSRQHATASTRGLRRRPQPELRRAVGRRRASPTLRATSTAGPHRSPNPRSERPRVQSTRAGRHSDQQPHLLQPGPASAGRPGLRLPARGAGVGGTRRRDGVAQRLREHSGLRPVRHHGHHGGLDVLDAPAASATRSRSAPTSSIRHTRPASSPSTSASLLRRAPVSAGTAPRTSTCSRPLRTPPCMLVSPGRRPAGRAAEPPPHVRDVHVPGVPGSLLHGRGRRQPFEDTLTSEMVSRPRHSPGTSTRRLDQSSAGRPGRDAVGPPQATIAMVNPAVVPEENVYRHLPRRGPI